MSQKEYDKLLGRDDAEKVIVEYVTNYFVNMKPRRTYQLGHYKQ